MQRTCQKRHAFCRAQKTRLLFATTLIWAVRRKEPTIEASRFPMIATWAQLWSLRVLFFVSLVVLPCALAGSGFPAFAFAVAWGPNGLFLVLFMRGALSLPCFLGSVKPVDCRIQHVAERLSCDAPARKPQASTPNSCVDTPCSASR